MLGLFALGSFAWLVCLALFVVAAPVIVACVALREAARHSRPAGPEPVGEEATPGSAARAGGTTCSTSRGWTGQSWPSSSPTPTTAWGTCSRTTRRAT